MIKFLIICAFTLLSISGGAAEKELIAETQEIQIFAFTSSFERSEHGLFLEVEMTSVKDARITRVFLIGVKKADCSKGGEILEYSNGAWNEFGMWSPKDETGMDRIGVIMCAIEDAINEKFPKAPRTKMKGIAI